MPSGNEGFFCVRVEPGVVLGFVRLIALMTVDREPFTVRERLWLSLDVTDGKR